MRDFVLTAGNQSSSLFISKASTLSRFFSAVFAFYLLVMVDSAAAFLSSATGDAVFRDTTDSPSSFNLLVPSQVAKSRNAPPPKRATYSTSRRPAISTSTSRMLMPSQLLKAHPDLSRTSEIKSENRTSVDSIAEVIAAPTSSSHPQQKRKKRKKKRPNSDGKNLNNAPKFSRKGNLPDIFWRTIPMEHLRSHPNFVSLPRPETIKELQRLEDIRLFRQDSWQWDAVHKGRCTTSQAVAALGFLEPEAARILKIPRSWQRGGHGAFHRLRSKALRTLDEMNDVLCQTGSDGDGDRNFDSDFQHMDIWKKQQQTRSGQKFPFAAKYLIPTTENDIQKRREQTRSYASSTSFDFSVRMMWGTAQESTSLLAALNYFWEKDNDVLLREVGMCGAGLSVNSTDGKSSLLLGASPDGLLCYSDGTIEVLEVKNHCPFFTTNFQTRKGVSSAARRKGKRFSLRSFDFNNTSVPSHYIPQLMMEMLCVGPNCKSAVMLRQSATDGALVLRIHRDDAWIEEMQYWLNCFQVEFVEKDEAPPQDFFLKGSDEAVSNRYARFLEWTNEIIRDRVEVIDRIPHGKIQRAMTSYPQVASLFLD